MKDQGQERKWIVDVPGALVSCTNVMRVGTVGGLFSFLPVCVWIADTLRNGVSKHADTRLGSHMWSGLTIASTGHGGHAAGHLTR